LLRQIDKSEDAANSGFNDLVIPDTYRDLLISVIESYSPNSKLRRDASQPKISSQMDIVRGKGRGLIILLHGPPGVGKTSTAETIAAYTKRPLYVLTSGDIGLTSSDIERICHITLT
jgi:flagellar biosynthesis GTPase FlhF